MFALVDSADYANLCRYHWSARKSKSGWYAIRKATVFGHRRTIFMHRQIMGADSNHQVHHINFNRLDNRRSNLQLVTPPEHHNIHHLHRISKKTRSGS